MKQIQNISECFLYRKTCTGSVGLVPTMGALHKGHFALIQKSLNVCNKTIVSIFVNPKQFGKNEDLESYPKTIEQDLEKLKLLGVDCVFIPSELEMYSDNHSLYVTETRLSKWLEGKSRPRVFSGVTTVVSKLFNLFQPTHAFFGQKDAQQLFIIKKLIADLNYNIKCVSVQTVRNDNGLALSSRNKYLSKKDQQSAASIYSGLLKIKGSLELGENNVKNLLKIFTTHIHQSNKLKIDYLAFSNLQTLDDVGPVINESVLISTAIYINSVRLIDNIIYTVEYPN